MAHRGIAYYSLQAFSLCSHETLADNPYIFVNKASAIVDRDGLAELKHTTG